MAVSEGGGTMGDVDEFDRASDQAAAAAADADEFARRVMRTAGVGDDAIREALRLARLVPAEPREPGTWPLAVERALIRVSVAWAGFSASVSAQEAWERAQAVESTSSEPGEVR